MFETKYVCNYVNTVLLCYCFQSKRMSNPWHRTALTFYYCVWSHVGKYVFFFWIQDVNSLMIIMKHFPAQVTQVRLMCTRKLPLRKRAVERVEKDFLSFPKNTTHKSDFFAFLILPSKKNVSFCTHTHTNTQGVVWCDDGSVIKHSATCHTAFLMRVKQVNAVIHL